MGPGMGLRLSIYRTSVVALLLARDDMGGLRLTGSRIKPVDGTEIPLALPGV